MPTTPPGISITKAKELLQQTDKLIASHPQVRHVLGKIGRAETATDPALKKSKGRYLPFLDAMYLQPTNAIKLAQSWLKAGS